MPTVDPQYEAPGGHHCWQDERVFFIPARSSGNIFQATISKSKLSNICSLSKRTVCTVMHDMHTVIFIFEVKTFRLQRVMLHQCAVKDGDRLYEAYST